MVREQLGEAINLGRFALLYVSEQKRTVGIRKGRFYSNMSSRGRRDAFPEPRFIDDDRIEIDSNMFERSNMTDCEKQ